MCQMVMMCHPDVTSAKRRFHLHVSNQSLISFFGLSQKMKQLGLNIFFLCVTELHF